MPFQISPGVNVTEIDLTTIIPAVSSTTGAFAGHFSWGPVGIRVLTDAEDTLVNNFYKPGSNTAVDFYTAANFLSYGNALYVARVVRDANASTRSSDTSVARNAHGNSNNNTNFVVKNQEDYNLNYSGGIAATGGWIAKYPGQLGNNIRISVCESANAYASTLSGTIAFSNGSTTATASANLANILTVGDILLAGPDRTEITVRAISATGKTITLKNAYIGNNITQSSVGRRWEFYNKVGSTPGTSGAANRNGCTNDEMHIIIADEDGAITGYANTVLEVHEGLSKAIDARSDDGTNIYYKDYINQLSRWVWWTGHPVGFATGRTLASAINFNAVTGNACLRPQNTSLTKGRDGSLPREADYINGYNLFRNAEDVDVSLVLAGASTQTRAIHIINNIVEYRKDCVAVFSPRYGDCVNNNSYSGKEQNDIIAYRNLLPSSSYAIMDSGWKYQYDKYNDLYRYVPSNGDTAGLMVRTDNDRDPWWSPAGYNRGGIKNVIKMSYNPGKGDRDQLYKNGINPIVTFPGQGTILFGDKTLLSKPSAFDRINVRRLFIVLEKAIATAAKFTLFEFNDAFTRAQFKAMVEPFLRDVQGRRGITDFRVVCDETNNTGEVIDRNEFIGDIYIKPARSINFIQLNFVAVRTGVDFTEVVGKF
jgi:phage tail sheath protein FI